MSSLLVFVFSNESGADRMIADIQSLQAQQLISISDAATVIRKKDGKIRIKQANGLGETSTLGGVFWGFLIGLIFFMPWLEMAAGAVSGAKAGKISGYGINDSFIKEVGMTIGPGHSALFLMVGSMTEDKVIESVSQNKATLLRTNLSIEDEIDLREAFGAGEVEM